MNIINLDRVLNAGAVVSLVQLIATTNVVVTCFPFDNKWEHDFPIGETIDFSPIAEVLETLQAARDLRFAKLEVDGEQWEDLADAYDTEGEG